MSSYTWQTTQGLGERPRLLYSDQLLSSTSVVPRYPQRLALAVTHSMCVCLMSVSQGQAGLRPALLSQV